MRISEYQTDPFGDVGDVLGGGGGGGGAGIYRYCLGVPVL